MASKFPGFNNNRKAPGTSYVLTPAMKDQIIDDYNQNERYKKRRASLTLDRMSFVGSTTTCERWIDERFGVRPAHHCPQNLRDEIDQKLAISAKGGDPWICRSDVIFYNGKAYDQKPYIKARLITRPGNVMYMEGKLTPPWNPGKSPCKYGPPTYKDKKPMTMGFNDNQFGKALNPCCTTSIYGDNVPPYVNIRSSELAYTEAGLPFGETIGYFRFKPEKVCDDGQPAITRLSQCCYCEEGRYNPAEYVQDECPTSTWCC
ncbi:hypothetical protein RRG08_026305 [Elysia crispata]|uniref:Uncharacterized protein n=1 Tax=Elysia crispata TaxID=231223 RepID=A0AAE0ZCD1_9GAST|nr:hypothetical protein RRG08_026305 [Elysia crispata]